MSNNSKTFEEGKKTYSTQVKKMELTKLALTSLLLTGSMAIIPQTLYGRDNRTRQPNNIITENANGLSKGQSENGTDVIYIVNPNNNGLSHNRYIEFNVGENNGVILNNSRVNGTSILGGNVNANTNLSNNAKVILNEVKGNNASNLNGGVEVFGPKSDLVIANENGINVNGANFINTGALNLSTGKVNVDGKNILLDTSQSLKSSLNIGEKGVKTDSDYFGLISRTVNINGEINDELNKKTNINIITGTNKVNLNTGDIEVVKTGEKAPTYAINGSHLGSMYGNNINIISTEEGAGVKHSGIIYSEKDIDINVKGNLENIGGTIKANNDIFIEANKVINKAILTSKEKITTNESDTIKHRQRGIIYYDYLVNINELNIEDLDKLTTKGGEITAGNNIGINHNTTGENRLIENVGGKIEAGKNAVLKGNITSKNLQREISIKELLSLIKVDLRWEHRSLVNNNYFNGKTVLTDGSLLNALTIIAQSSKNSGYYNALKQVDNPTLNYVLASVLGEDWRSRNVIKSASDWNMKGTIVLNTNSESIISANENLVLKGGNIELGNRIKQNSKGLVVGDTKVNGITNGITIGDSNNIVSAGKSILIDGGNVNSGNTKINAKEDAIILSNNNINLFGTSVKGENIVIGAGKNIDLETSLTINEQGNQDILNKTSVEGNYVNIKGNNVKLKGSNINGNTRIDANNLNVESQQLINSSYVEKHVEGTKRILNDHAYTTETKSNVVSNSSEINGNNILVNVNNNMSTKNSKIVGNDKNSIVVINVGQNLNVSNTENASYEKTTSDVRGNVNGTYKLVEVRNSETASILSKGSDLLSDKNLYVKAKNLEIKGSTVKSKEELVLDVAEKTKLSESIETKTEKITNFSIGSSTNYNTSNSKEKNSNGSVIQGGKVTLMSGGDIENSGAQIVGEEKVTIKSDGNIINRAISDEKESTKTNVTVGIVASGKVGVGGLGASGSINTLTGQSSSSVSGVNDLLKPNGSYLGDVANGNVAVKLNVTNENVNSTKWENSEISSNNGNVEIESKGTLDIGGVNISGKTGVSLTGSEIETTKYTNSEEKTGNVFNMSIGQSVDVASETANKINSIVQDVHTIKDIVQNVDITQAEKVVETGKNIKKTVESFPELATKDVANITSKQNVSLDYTHTINNEKSDNVNSISSENGEITLTSTNGDINLVGTNVKGKDVSLNSSENLNISAGEKSEFSESDGIKASLTVTEKIAVNIRDGVSAKAGLNVNGGYSGSTKLTNTGIDSTIEAENIVINSNNDTNINGGRLTADNVTLNSENLNISNTKTKTYEDNRAIGVNADVALGVSSNTVVTGDGTVSGNLSYTGKGGVDVTSQSGIIANNSFNGVVNGNVNNRGGLILENGKKANLTVGGVENNSADVTFNISGGINGSTSVSTTGQNFKLNGNIDAVNVNLGILNANETEKYEISIETEPIKDVVTEEKIKKIINGE